MIKWREGKAGFVGGSKRLIKGFFSAVYTVTTAFADTPEIIDGILSSMTSDGFGTTGAITSDGGGILSTMSNDGIVSAINIDGFGVTSIINADGDGIISTQ